MQTFVQDVRYGWRMLVKNPGFTLVAILTLALGIGANTAMFSVIDAALLTPLGISKPDRAVIVWTEDPQRGWHHLPASYPDYQDWKDSGVFSALGAARDTGFNFRYGDTSEHVEGLLITPEVSQVLNTPPELGRLFQPEDAQPGHENVVLLSDQLWRSRFGGDPNIVGKSVVLDGTPHTVVGVLPRRFPKTGDEQIYTPLIFQPPYTTDRGKRSFLVMGRLAPGISVQAAQQRMADLSRRLARQYPEQDAGGETLLQPLEAAYVEDLRVLLLILLGVVGFVLLIACANLANLLLVRGTARQREMAIRIALGAKPSVLFRQLITESVVLSVLGGGLGILLVLWGLRLISSFNLKDVPNADLITFNGHVLVFNIALSFATGILFGLAPAMQAWRANVNDALKSALSTTGKLGHHRLRGAFVVGQVTLTFLLLAGAGLMIRSFLHVRDADPGYNSHGVLSMSIALSARQYDTPEKQNAFYEEVMRRIRALPGVLSVAAADELPTGDSLHGSGLHFTDRPEPKPGDQPIVMFDSVTPDYFRAMQIPLLRGRSFTDSDRANTPGVVVIDQWAAKHYWPGQDPVGKRIKLEKKGPELEIVGVVGDIYHPVFVFLPLMGQVYLPLSQAAKPNISLAIRADGPVAVLAGTVRKLINNLDVDQPVFKVQTLDAARAEANGQSRVAAQLLGAFAAVGLLLAMIGIYGVVAYTVSQRTREIGIRIALGATRSDVLRLILRQGIVLAAIGAVLGLAAAVGLTRVMSSLLHGVAPTDITTFALASAVLVAMALLASYVPSRRAAKVDPMVALRYE